MKNFFICSIFLCLALNIFAGDNEKKIKSEIKDVTVFLSGASVTSEGSAVIGTGANDVVFENLSPYIDVNTIQAKGEGDFTILSVSSRLNYLNNQPKPKEIKELEDSLETLQQRAEMQRKLGSVYENEEAMLLANKSIGGQNTGVNSAELEKVANILRSRLTDLMMKQIECKKKEKKINNEIAKINNQLNEFNAKRNKNTGEIIVTVSSKTGGNAKISVTYNVSNAGWSPIYDIRAIDASNPVKLEYRANVFQNTGVDWKNVNITLSTGNPTVSGTKPVLAPWWLAYYTPRNKVGHRYKIRSELSNTNAPAVAEGYALEEIQVVKNADYSSSYTEVNESQTNINYEITIPYNIPSDNKPYSVGIQTFNIPATYRYYCAPKLDNDAFLLAKITGWDQYNLLSGQANVFFEGTFVGKSYLDTKSTGDTLDISLGRDKNVVVTRMLLKEFSDKKIIGLNKKETRMYEISVRNKKKSEIEIDIDDQVPLSSNNEIEVEMLESSGAKYDKTTGKLTWSMKLTTGETKKMKFGYTVKYPKDKVVSIF